MDEVSILVRLGKIEQELSEIRKYLLKKDETGVGFKLGGLLDNIEISEEDIATAKKSVFKVPNE